MFHAGRESVGATTEVVVDGGWDSGETIKRERDDSADVQLSDPRSR
jgi:hypothetical protein